jgi:hypothetical protein
MFRILTLALTGSMALSVCVVSINPASAINISIHNAPSISVSRPSISVSRPSIAFGNTSEKTPRTALRHTSGKPPRAAFGSISGNTPHAAFVRGTPPGQCSLMGTRHPRQ